MERKEKRLREDVQMTGRGRIGVEEYCLLPTENIHIHM